MRFVVILCLAALAGSPVWAQSKPMLQVVREGQPSARQMELSRRYVQIVQSDQLEGTIRQMIAGEANNDASLRDMPSEDRQFMIDLATELTTDLLPQMMDRLVPVYAATFSEEELSALVEFYDTPLGRSIAEKTITSMPEQNAAMMSVMPQLFEKMAVRMCARYGCDPAEVRAAMAGQVPGMTAQGRVK